MDNMVEKVKTAVYNAVVRITRRIGWWMQRIFAYPNYGK